MDDEILAVVEASAIRRWMGIAMLAFVAFLVLYVAFATPPDLLWQIFLMVVGGIALWTAERMRRATTARLELTRTELRDSVAGTIVALDDIATVLADETAPDVVDKLLDRHRERLAESVRVQQRRLTTVQRLITGLNALKHKRGEQPFKAGAHGKDFGNQCRKQIRR